MASATQIRREERKEKGASAKIWDKKGRHRLTYMGHISGFGMSEKYIKCVYSIQLKNEENVE